MAFQACCAFYILTHTPTGLYYVGSTRNLRSRLQDHRVKLEGGRHYSTKLQEAFTSWHDITVTAEYTETPDQALRLEQARLDRCFLDTRCCNSRQGATAGPEISNEGKARLSKLKSERVVSAETRQLMSERRKGRKVEYSEEGYKNLREKLSAHVMTDDHRRKISEAKKGVPKSPEQRQRLIDMGLSTARAVMASGQKYRSVKAASEELGISQRTIVRRIEDDRYADWYYAE